MHALQRVGYNGDDNDLADLAETVLSVNELQQTTVDTRLNPHLWNEMSIEDKRSWQHTPRDLKKFLVSQLNQAAPAPTQAGLKPPLCPI